MHRRAFVKLVASTGASLSMGGLGAMAGCDRPRVPRARRPVDAVGDAVLRDFATGFHGTLLRPADTEYDRARRVWNGRFDRHPGLIARCRDAADVQRAVDLARAERLLVAVRGGGHSFAGYGACDGGLVIDLSAMKALRIDRDEQVVTAAPGLVAAELDTATQGTGLALVLGGCGSVGIGGFTLGGGEGVLSGKYGLSCDNLLSAEVVLADGRLVTASPQENADLFWALRGGGGNFGVVTTLRFRAHPVTHVIAGHLVYDVAQAPAVLRAFRAFAPTAPDELTVGFTCTQVGRAPALVLGAVLASDVAAAAPVLHSLRGLAKATADTIGPVAYHAFHLANPGPPPGFPTMARGAFLPELTDDAIDAVSAVAAATPPAAEFEINHLHGAVSRVPLAAAAFPLRQPGFDCFAIAGWLAAEQRDAAVAWVERCYEAVRASARGAYVNVLNEQEADRVAGAYGSQYARLAALKRAYDPENLFQLNANIPPAGRG